jgi:hypothetical protein
MTLLAPANERATAIGSTSITDAWDAVAGAAGYEITVWAVPPTTYVATGLTPSTAYTMTVKAYDVQGVRGAPSSIQVTTSATGATVQSCSASLSTTGAITAGTTSSSSVNAMVYDMYGTPYRSSAPGAPWGANEATPPVNPAWDWYDGARPGLMASLSGYAALQPWAQAIGYSGTLSGVSIQVNTIQVHALVGSTWSVIFTATGIGGGLYGLQDFASNGSLSTSSLAGGLGQYTFVPGYINHWWSSDWPRLAVPSNAIAFSFREQVRYAGGDASTRILAIASSDAYPTTTSTSGNDDLLMPRHKFLTTSWQWFTATTLTEAQIRANPPPILS